MTRTAACFAVAWVLSGTGAQAGVLSPTREQRVAFRASNPDAKVGLVQLVTIRDPAAFDAYVAASADALRAAGGRRVYGGDFDVVPGDPFARFDSLLLDECPSPAACLEVIDAVSAERALALSSQFVFAMDPSSRFLLRVVRIVGWFVSAVAGRDLTDAAAPTGILAQRGPTQEGLARFFAGDPGAPLGVFNLNRYREHAAYPADFEGDFEVGGEEAYGRYGRASILELFRRGAFPIWRAKPDLVLVGDPRDPFSGAWDDFVLVYYPSRRAMRDMLNSEAWQGVVHHRVAGMDTATVIPGTPWPAFDPGN